MVTIEEIKKAYDVDMTGVIKSPGKFEGEKIYSPYFFEFYLNGFGGDEIYINDELYNCYEITKDDRAMFPEDLNDNDCGVILWENSQGFVYCTVYNETDYKKEVNHLEDLAEKESEKEENC
jgi:hypothetical protein